MSSQCRFRECGAAVALLVAAASAASAAAPVPELQLLHPAQGQRIQALPDGRGTTAVACALDAATAAALRDSDSHAVCYLYDGTRECEPYATSALALGAAAPPVEINGMLPGERVLAVELADAAGAVVARSATVRFYVVSPTPSGGGGGVDIDIMRARVGSGEADDVWAATVFGGSGGDGDGGDRGAATDTAALRAHYFDEVYRHKFWSANGANGADSGPGSNMEETVAVREALLEVIRTSGVRTILDIPCGDMAWMRHVELPDGVTYVGADVSPALIARNKAAFERPGGRYHFAVADAVEGDALLQIRIDGKPPDLIFCRHMAYHLPPADNLKVLARFEQTGAPLLMMTTYLRADANLDPYVLAQGHPVNLFRAPYCVRDAERLYRDNGRDIYMGLWANKGPGRESLMDPGAGFCLGAGGRLGRGGDDDVAGASPY